MRNMQRQHASSKATTQEQQDEIDQMIREGNRASSNLDWLDSALDKIA